jgi:nucleoside-diphosphate kinase
MERTLIIAKPDAIQRGLVGQIVHRFERKGLKLIGMKMMQLDDALLQAHYAHILDEPFYKDIEKYMKSSPVVVMAWEGYECTAAVRIIVGPTQSREADGGTIRGDYAMAKGRNIIHASDSKESGAKEVKRFFKEDEIFQYDKTEYAHIYDYRELKG